MLHIQLIVQQNKAEHF